MGIAFKDLIPSKEINLRDLSGKVAIVDSFNLLYQFITTIRGPDGKPLMDSKGNVTSHIVGLFSRTTNLMGQGIKLAFVFDGEAPELKKQERERRKEAKLEAEKLYEEAKQKEDIESMKKYASRTSRLTSEMIADAKELLTLLGLPIIQAPSEGEAQAAHIANKENCYVISQDYDSLLHGAPNLLKNISILGRRKRSDRLSYATVKPEVINLAETINHLGIDRDQLIALAMLIGTDYNPGGIKGIGPKKALDLVKQYGSDLDALFQNANWAEHCKHSWNEIFYTIKKIPLTDEYTLEWKSIQFEKLHDFLKSRDFSDARITTALEKLEKKEESKKQKSLGDFT